MQGTWRRRRRGRVEAPPPSRKWSRRAFHGGPGHPQEEFYFTLPTDRMDLCLYGYNHEVPCADVAPAVGLTAEQVDWVYRDIVSKRRATRYLHALPLLAQPVGEV